MAVIAITVQQIIKMGVMIFIGILCYRVKILDSEKCKTLSNLLIKVITPALIVASFQREYDSTLLKNMLLSVGMAIISMALAHLIPYIVLRKKEGYDITVERCAATYSNCGFIGYPLAYGIFGSEGLFYMVAFNLIFNLCVYSVCEATMRGSFGKGFLKHALLNPVTIASVIGVIFFVCQIHIPALIYEPLDMIGGMNSPLAMLVAGVSIAQMDIPKLLKKKRIYLVSLLKLLVIPVVFLLIFRFLPIPELVYMTMVLATACPTATITIMFSLLYGHDDIYASEIFTASVIFSMFTIPAVFAIAVL